jgi:hypothetical protein
MNLSHWLTRSIATTKTAFAVFTLLVLGTAQIWAQAVSTGNIAGQVIDEQNAAVAGASVKITDTSTNIVLSTTTNDTGRYVISNITPGTYNISISKAGFSTFEINGQAVEVGVSLSLNAKMRVGSTATTIEVSATVGAELQTANATVGTTMSGQQLLELPNLGRDVTTLTVLQPGVMPGGFVAGAQRDQTSFLLDGGNNSDDMGGDTITYQTNFTGTGGQQTSGMPSGILPTPVESVEEFKVNTFGQTSDFNSSIGSQVQMVTKRGTNQYHGSAYFYYFGTDVGAANSWTNDHTPSNGLPYTAIVPNHRDRFGGSLGGPMTPKFAGGKTYFFFNYEGLRFPNDQTYERLVPSATMREGVIYVPNSAGAYQPYNLNPAAVTVNGTSLAPATCPVGACDPRGTGLNPLINQLWSKYMPIGNDPIYGTGDGFNTIGYISQLSQPLTSNTYVTRIDHDFGEKNRLMATYRDLSLINLTSNQVDIGGAFSGDTLGTPIAKAPRPQKPDLMVFALTSNLTPTITNDLRFNYTRNFWQWEDNNSPAQLPGLGGALEIGAGAGGTAESTNALIPYNVNTQQTRQRFWDGQDKILRDDITMIKSNHLLTLGGMYQRNFDYHMRTDNGNGTNNQIVYQISGQSYLNWGTGSGSYIPTAVGSSYASTWENLYAETVGIVNLPQVVYTRAGSSLALQPVGTVATDKSVIPTYNFYFADSWHVKPTLTINYGISYGLEMPPYSQSQNQVVLVDSADNPINTAAFLAARQKAALQGQAYNPTLGYALNTNAGSGLKYPYNPFYGGFSPRVSMAWNPRFSEGVLGKLFGNGKTVVRAGYGRIWGRLNGVDLVLVPLLGPGVLQAVSCPGASSAGTCLGSGGVSPATAFRIGTDGMSAPMPTPSATLPQPFYPNVNGAAAGDVDTLDPNYKPERTDNFNVALQREINSKTTLEVGYVGRIIRNEYTEVNIDAVPTMMTLGGQTFSAAFSQVYWQLYNQGFASSSTVGAQPFFENALGGASSSYCAGYSSCTQAVVSKNSISDFKYVETSTLWAAMNKASSWVLGQTMASGAGQVTSAALNASMGWGNYNGIYTTLRARDYHGATFVSNFTWSRSLGTAAQYQATSANTVVNPFDIAANYGPNGFDYLFVYNAAVFYKPRIFQHGTSLLSRIAGGWTIAPLFTAQSGAPNAVGYSQGTCSSCMTFGESSSSGEEAYGDQAVLLSKFTGGTSANYGITGTTSSSSNPYVPSGTLVGGNNSSGVNMFTNPAAVAAEFRPCVLGTDTNCGGYGGIRGMPTWNLDATLAKDFNLWKENRIGATLTVQFTNILNHNQMTTPNGVENGSSLSLTALSTFGRTTTQANTPRNMEFGFRVHF